MTGSAALYYLTNTEYRSDQSVRLRREVIQVVLNGMEHYQEVTVSIVTVILLLPKNVYIYYFFIIIFICQCRLFVYLSSDSCGYC